MIAEALTESRGRYAPVILVDSMQVYREIQIISNQERRRPALLSSVKSVSEEWTVAHHRRMAREKIEEHDTPCVIDAGTGMYLNAVLLDFPVSGKVPEKVRQRARNLTKGEINPRRESRKRELMLAGEPETGSVWDGGLVYKTSLVYLRPERGSLDEKIGRRSRHIAARATQEAETLIQMSENGKPPNGSVRDSIGVREMVDYALGKISLEEAEQRINTRTRKLSRRQMRWFDKLTRTLENRAEITVIRQPEEITNYMHDIIGT